MKNHLSYIAYFSALLMSCQEPYTPELKAKEQEKILVVEGYINANGNSEYTLSYVAPAYQAADSTHTSIHNARLAIEEENGTPFSHNTYQGNSRYLIHHPALSPTSKYRLQVKIGDRIYVSEYVPVLMSPEIENITWKQNASEGVKFYIDTRSEEQKYYRWELEETWKFKTPQSSLFLFDGQSLRERTEHELFPDVCFRSEKSSAIHLHSTELQQGNIIQNFNIHFIPNLSEKLDIRYSILVKQYVLTEKAFGYWNLVRENSEGLGDIFGPMPTELSGNITCISHPGEKVVGLIEAGSVSQKRIFLNYTELPVPWVSRYAHYGFCLARQSIPANQALLFFAESPLYVPIGEVLFEDSETVTHYTYSVRACLDCTTRGNKATPSFWQD